MPNFNLDLKVILHPSPTPLIVLWKKKWEWGAAKLSSISKIYLIFFRPLRTSGSNAEDTQVTFTDVTAADCGLNTEILHAVHHQRRGGYFDSRQKGFLRCRLLLSFHNAGEMPTFWNFLGWALSLEALCHAISSLKFWSGLTAFKSLCAHSWGAVAYNE